MNHQFTPESTRAFLLFWFAALIVYAIGAALSGPREATISYVFGEFIRENPLVGVALGAFLGHALWRL